ncbi:G-type lectin S-receptor-like serine/threonine-protein kinase CES101 isoform X1 [Senna tora]|uniref:Acidic endochitinase n=1 Tax=Senna tora TaxID=362788 RepID=A0A834TC36_9FABA|nr:G-type lectin S-receptor-like serine/threonine-protein kinase CES101 isoform X1 [Senna tora]
MPRILQSPSFFLLPLLFLIKIATTDADAVYWGQNFHEGNLKDTCATGRYSIVVISLLHRFGNGQIPQLYLPGHCNPSSSSSSSSSSSGCTVLHTDIKYCQKQEIKVMLSIGGGFGTYNLSSSKEALNLSDYLWNNFLGGNSSSRPLGDAILDGIDFDIESSTPYLDDLARDLKSHPNVYLSASPQCLFPDSILRSALDTGLFDYVWAKFYNNPSCEYTETNHDSFVNKWNQWTTSLKNAKILLGLPASPAASISGYIAADLFVSKVFPVVNKSSNYGGVMLWSRYDDKVSGYSTVIENSPLCGQQSPPICRSSDSGFLQRFGYMSADSNKVYEIDNLGVLCCEIICSSRCSCVAYAFVNEANSTGCQIWGNGKFIEDPSANRQPIYVFGLKGNQSIQPPAPKGNMPIPPSEANRRQNFVDKHKGLLYSLYFHVTLLVDRKMRQMKILHEIGGNAMLSVVYGKARRNKKHRKASNEVEIFSYESIVAATNNFSTDNKLGEGGFGPVYKVISAFVY